MNLIVVTPPPAEPVTLTDVYDHLRLTLSDESPPAHPHDAMLERHIRTARMQAESITQRAFVEQTLRLYTDRFPYPYYYFHQAEYWLPYHGRGYVELLRPPLIAVQSVQYYDEENALQAVDAENYFVSDDLVPRLSFVDGFVSPTPYLRHDALRIDYVAGYPPEGSPAEDYAANVPDPIKDAILLGVELLYRSQDTKNRETLERARDALLQPYTIYSV